MRWIPRPEETIVRSKSQNAVIIFVDTALRPVLFLPDVGGN